MPTTPKSFDPDIPPDLPNPAEVFLEMARRANAAQQAVNDLGAGPPQDNHPPTDLGIGAPVPVGAAKGSPMIRRYAGKGVRMVFASGYVQSGKLVEIDHYGFWGRLDRGYDQTGARREPKDIPERRVISVNLRRCEVIE